MTTFVLVHGAWHGGWCWRRVAEVLQRAGHRVFTPTLTGLGERSHLLRPGIDLDLHILDIVNVLKWEGLREVVLCGHSYGGMVVTGVADAVAERLAALVYLDAFVPRDGEAVVELLLAERRSGLEQDRRRHGDGWRLTPVPAAAFGVTDPADQAWVDGACTAQPWATLTQPIRLGGAHEKVRRRSYILAGAYTPSAFEPYGAMARDSADWHFHSLPTGHDAMMTMPAEVAKLLEEAAI